MGRGTKRKTKQNEEAKPAEENNNQSSKATSRAKRAKTSKPQAEPEYFEEKRNLVYILYQLIV